MHEFEIIFSDDFNKVTDSIIELLKKYKMLG
jgi:hypothetical protein